MPTSPPSVTINVDSPDALLNALAAGRPSDLPPGSAWSIALAPGDFALAGPLSLEAGKHDGLTLKAAYPASPPRLHTLQAVSGWEEITWQGRTVWRTALTDEAVPRLLFANGVQRPRARWPKFDPKLRPEAVLRARPYPEGQVPKLHHGTNRLPLNPADFPVENAHLFDAEVVVMHFWVAERLPHLHFSRDTGELVSSRRTAYRLTEGTKPLPVRYYFENLLEALTDPGEWCFLESTRMLYYRPHAGEVREQTRIEVPMHHRLMVVGGDGFAQSKGWGDAIHDRRLRGLRIENLMFGPCNWLPVVARNLEVDRVVPETGLSLASSVQAEIDAGGAMEIAHAEDIVIAGCSFRETGAHAIRVGHGCQRVTVEHSRFQELGGGALVVRGGDVGDPAADRTREVCFADNIVEGIGRVFHGACGVTGAVVEAMAILHNRISDTFYSAISLGWSWGYADTVSARHRVEGNDIADVSQGLLNDLGGIYFVGRNTGTIVRRNLLRNVRAAQFGARGIYLDEGCVHFLIEQNVVCAAGDSGVNMHYGRGHLIRENLFLKSETGVRLSRDDGGGTFTAWNNVFWHVENPFSGGYAMPNLADSSVRADRSWVHPQSNSTCHLRHPPYLGHEIVAFSAWQEAGNDLCAQFIDPLITLNDDGIPVVDPASPLRTAGFPLWSWESEVGPRACKGRSGQPGEAARNIDEF